MNKNLFSAEMKIQYLVNIGRSPINAECRPSPITRALSLPSSSVCAVATYSAEAPPRMHQNSPFSDKKLKNLWGGGTILRRSLPICVSFSLIGEGSCIIHRGTPPPHTPPPSAPKLGPPNFKTVVAPLTHLTDGQTPRQ